MTRLYQIYYQDVLHSDFVTQNVVYAWIRLQRTAKTIGKTRDQLRQLGWDVRYVDVDLTT